MQDINLKITDRNGETHEIVAPTDMTINLMEVIRSYALAEEGTIGVCGGMAMCASCQVYVIDGAEKLQEMGDEEDAMLAEAYHVEENSRLGCQIPITEEIEGLEERLKSRFGWGLTVAVEPPELETRVAILMNKAEVSNIPLEYDVAFFIAKKIRSNVRELRAL